MDLVMMEAGRDLDALVAQRVFKWRPLFSPDGRVRELWPPTVEPFSPKPDWSQCAEPPDWGLVPYYSTSISDAWRIVTRMTDRMGEPSHPGFSWEGPLYKPPGRDLGDERFPAGAACWYVAYEMDGERRLVCAATAPLAVSLAALRIVEAEEAVNRDLRAKFPSEE